MKKSSKIFISQKYDMNSHHDLVQCLVFQKFRRFFHFFSRKTKCQSINNQHTSTMQKTRILFMDSRKSIILPKFHTRFRILDSDLVHICCSQVTQLGFADMFWDISMGKLTETEICLKQPLQQLMLIPRVLGMCGSVFYVSSTSEKSYKHVYGNNFEYFLPARI